MEREIWGRVTGRQRNRRRLEKGKGRGRAVEKETACLSPNFAFYSPLETIYYTGETFRTARFQSQCSYFLSSVTLAKSLTPPVRLNLRICKIKTIMPSSPSCCEVK